MAWGIGLAVTIGACAPAPQGELLRIQDDQFTIGDPSKDRAWATGIGCGGTEGEAVANARNIAQFNLRGLTGAARYRVEYRVLRRVADERQACVEVEARAAALRPR
jgi:hypothetical protein